MAGFPRGLCAAHYFSVKDFPQRLFSYFFWFLTLITGADKIVENFWNFWTGKAEGRGKKSIVSRNFFQLP
tara:strand:+ start:127 stop:336 length:210 start_codon:yes stop_codon:yes gene_type:complete